MYMNPIRILKTMAGTVLGNHPDGRRANTGYTRTTTPAAAPVAQAQQLATAQPRFSTFVLTGPLQWLPPATFDAGPLGKLSVNGIVTVFSGSRTIRAGR